MVHYQSALVLRPAAAPKKGFSAVMLDLGMGKVY